MEKVRFDGIRFRSDVKERFDALSAQQPKGVGNTEVLDALLDLADMMPDAMRGIIESKKERA